MLRALLFLESDHWQRRAKHLKVNAPCTTDMHVRQTSGHPHRWHAGAEWYCWSTGSDMPRIAGMPGIHCWYFLESLAFAAIRALAVCWKGSPLHPSAQDCRGLANRKCTLLHSRHSRHSWHSWHAGHHCIASLSIHLHSLTFTSLHGHSGIRWHFCIDVMRAGSDVFDASSDASSSTSLSLTSRGSSFDVLAMDRFPPKTWTHMVIRALNMRDLVCGLLVGYAQLVANGYVTLQQTRGVSLAGISAR